MHRYRLVFNVVSLAMMLREGSRVIPSMVPSENILSSKGCMTKSTSKRALIAI